MIFALEKFKKFTGKHVIFPFFKKFLLGISKLKFFCSLTFFTSPFYLSSCKMCIIMKTELVHREKLSLPVSPDKHSFCSRLVRVAQTNNRVSFLIQLDLYLFLPCAIEV